MEEELRAGPLDDGGAAAGGVLVVGMLYLEVVGAGVAPRLVGADCREVQDGVRPAELLVLLHGS